MRLLVEKPVVLFHRHLISSKIEISHYHRAFVRVAVAVGSEVRELSQGIAGATRGRSTRDGFSFELYLLIAIRYCMHCTKESLFEEAGSGRVRRVRQVCQATTVVSSKRKPSSPFLFETKGLGIFCVLYWLEPASCSNKIDLSSPSPDTRRVRADGTNQSRRPPEDAATKFTHRRHLCPLSSFSFCAKHFHSCPFFFPIRCHFVPVPCTESSRFVDCIERHERGLSPPTRGRKTASIRGRMTPL